MDWAALPEVGPYLVAVLVLVGLSAFFSGTEVAMFSLRRVDRERLARSERRSEKLVRQLLSRPRRLIATVLIGNEIVNVSISATLASVSERILTGYGELTVVMFAQMKHVPRHGESIQVGGVTLTVLSATERAIQEIRVRVGRRSKGSLQPSLRPESSGNA